MSGNGGGAGELCVAVHTTHRVSQTVGSGTGGHIVRMQRITRVPKVQSYIKGVINLRGEIIPVISLRLKMGLDDDEITKATRIIIIKLESGDSIGVLVDAVEEVVTLEQSQIEKVAYDSKDKKANFINGVGKDKDRLISLLDVNATFTDKDGQ